MWEYILTYYEKRRQYQRRESKYYQGPKEDYGWECDWMLYELNDRNKDFRERLDS